MKNSKRENKVESRRITGKDINHPREGLRMPVHDIKFLNAANYLLMTVVLQENLEDIQWTEFKYLSTNVGGKRV